MAICARMSRVPRSPEPDPGVDLGHRYDARPPARFQELGRDIAWGVSLRRGDPKPGGNLYAPAAPNGGQFTDALGDRRPIRATEPAHPPLLEARVRRRRSGRRYDGTPG